MRKLNKNQKGFLLIELIVAVALFVVVMTISMGSILGIFESNRKSKAVKDVASNLNFMIESMAKEIRFGTNYHCGLDGDPNPAVPQNCIDGINGSDYLSFLAQDGINQITYQLNGTSIEKNSIPISASSVEIDNLRFYVFGAGTADWLQPRVLILIKAHSVDVKSRTDFVVQTLVTQRALDVP